MKKYLPAGKISPAILEKLFKKFYRSDRRVIVGPKIGEDSAVIDMGDKYLIDTTDPITLTTDEPGKYAVNINANDIAVMGASPKWFLATVLFPENKTSENQIEEIFSQISETCKTLGVTLCGGHTEVTGGIDRVIIVGHMLGEVAKDKLVTSSGAKVGDFILLIKGIAIEGTSIIAREKYQDLKEKVSLNILERAKNFINHPGISVVKEALLLANNVKINSMHDPTEGGLAMGLYELALASNVGLIVSKNEIKIYKETDILCKEYDINPMNLIASGALLLTLPKDEVRKASSILEDNDIEFSVIGKISPRKEGMKIIIKGSVEELRYSEKDEIIKIY